MTLETNRSLAALVRQFVQSAPVFIAVGFAVLFAAIAIVLPRLPATQLNVHIDMSASSGSDVSLYLNTIDVPPQSLPLDAGVRHDYVFAAPRGAVARITPVLATEAGVVVRVYSIYVTEGRSVIATFTPSDLAGWAQYYFGAGDLTSSYLQLVSTAPSATIDAFRTVAVPGKLPYPLNFLEADSTETTGRLQISLFTSALLLALLLFVRRKSRLFAVIALIDTAVVIYVLHVLLARPAPLGPVGEAVGNASYYGQSPVVDVHALVGSAVVALIIGAITGVVLRRRVPRPLGGPIVTDVQTPTAEPKAPLVGVPSRSTRMLARFAAVPRVWWIVLATAIIGLATFLPDIVNGIDAARSEQFVEGWDSDNLLVWTALAARGLVPMKNFWYPYGDELFFQANLVWGPLALFVCQMLSFAGFSTIFWKLSGRRVTLTVFALVTLALFIPFLGEYSRYGVSMSIAVMFAALRWTAPGRGRNVLRVAFTLLLGSALFTELDVAGYGALGAVCVVVFGGALFSSGARAWLRELAFDLVGPIAIGIAWLIVTALQGQLAGELQFYLHPGTLEAYSALEPQLQVPLGAVLSLSNLVLWSPAVMLAAAVLFRVWCRRATILSTAIIGLVGATGPLLDKDAVRSIGGDLYLPLVLGVLCALVSIASWAIAANSRVAALFAGAMCGAIFASGVASGEWATVWPGFRNIPHNVASDIATVVSPPSDLHTVEASRYSVSHFSNYPDVLALERVMAPLVRGSTSDVYVLGDVQTLYLMLNQQVPWEINLYNSSPIEDQRRIVSWIAQNRPRYVVVDGEDGEAFDGVPNPVRAPILYQDVIDHYAFVRSVGSFDILERTEAAPKRSASYWVSRLGGTISLGSVVASIPRGEAIVQGKPKAVLRVVVAHPKGQTVTVPLVFGGLEESVSFTTVAGRSEYEIPLNRLWAWAISTRVRIGAAPTGVQTTLLRGSFPSSVLY